MQAGRFHLLTILLALLAPSPSCGADPHPPEATRPGAADPADSEDGAPVDVTAPTDSADLEAFVPTPPPDEDAAGTGHDGSDTEAAIHDTPHPSPEACLGSLKPFLCPCDLNDQCESGFCASVNDPETARRCTRHCDDGGCPAGWLCQNISSSGDPTYLCQQPQEKLCAPCSVRADCQHSMAECLRYADGTFCGSHCEPGGPPCPEGFQCEEALNPDGQRIAYQCQPQSGSCLCEMGLDYQNDPDHCGGCLQACHFPNAIPACTDGECGFSGCQAGWHDLNGLEADGCEYRCTFQSDEDWPDPSCNEANDCDQNCDGIDGTVARAIFVASYGSDHGAGSPSDPLRTIHAALAMAGGDRDHIYVSAGTYHGSLELIEGISIFGGYAADGSWRRDLNMHISHIRADIPSADGAIRTIIADGIHQAPTVLDGFHIEAGGNANPGGSSYAIWIRNSGEALNLSNLTAVGGQGGPGAPGTQGNPGGAGAAGKAGFSSASTSGGVLNTCTDCNCNNPEEHAGPGGLGGANTCPGRNAQGGRGGDPSCGDNATAQPGADSPAGARGGLGGQNGSAGQAGLDGGDGESGIDGRGGDAHGRTTNAGFWFGDEGGPGEPGRSGVGGGGGGGGGGAANSIVRCASWGGSGGGGGAGGCGGRGGSGGKAGGASFGLFLYDASPTLSHLKLGRRHGGNGGQGGQGGTGGQGGLGAEGGIACPDAGDGGHGGRGGQGGRGGHGGGGAGGVAYSLYLAGNSDPSCEDLSFDSTEYQGIGGVGGLSATSEGNRGADGAHGPRNRPSPRCP